MNRSILICVLGVVLILLGSGCAGVEKRPAVVKAPPPHRLAWVPRARPVIATHWNDEGAKGPPKIVVSISRQRAWFYKGKKVVGESSVSTGRKGFDTPPGTYKVTEKDQDHRSNLYGNYVDADGDVVKRNVAVRKDPRPPGATFVGTKMPYFMRFTGGYGLHAGYIPGYRASHGCIRMPQAMAARFFNGADIGTTVVVKQ